MDYKIILTFGYGGLFFILLRKQVANFMMEYLIKTFNKKNYTKKYQKFLEYWFLIFGIFFLLVAVHEIFSPN